MRSTITLAKHILTGDIVHIKEADNGLSCNCECVECGEVLEAIQGNVRLWHFRHNKNKDCSGGQESALHQLAKEILKRNTKIRIGQAEIFEYHTASLEKIYGTFRVDVVLGNLDNEIVIEIAVTHFVEKEKEGYFKANQVRAIEIDLSKVDLQIGVKELESLLINESQYKRMIYPAEERDVGVESDNSWMLTVGVAILGILGVKRYLKKKRKKRPRIKRRGVNSSS